MLIFSPDLKTAFTFEYSYKNYNDLSEHIGMTEFIIVESCRNSFRCIKDGTTFGGHEGFSTQDEYCHYFMNSNIKGYNLHTCSEQKFENYFYEWHKKSLFKNDLRNLLVSQ